MRVSGGESVEVGVRWGGESVGVGWGGESVEVGRKTASVRSRRLAIVDILNAKY